MAKGFHKSINTTNESAAGTNIINNMAIKRQTVLNGIKSVINEGLTPKTAGYKSNLHLKKLINTLLTESSSNPDIMSFIRPFSEALDHGVREELVARQLLEGAKQYVAVLPGIKESVEDLSKSINENAESIDLVTLYETISNEAFKESVRDSLFAYLGSKTLNNKANLMSLLEMFVGADKNASDIYNYLKNTGYDQVETVEDINEHQIINESDVEQFGPKKFVRGENGQLIPIEIVDTDAILENVNEYINDIINESKANENAAPSYKDVDNQIKLAEAINTIYKADPENQVLCSVLSEYQSALNAGCREEMLYETFMKRMEDGFSYINEVEDVLKAMNERINGKETNIKLVKILEMMSNDYNYSYLVPIIEDVVVQYEQNPNPNTRNVLLNHLHLYESCPYVIEIMSVVNSNNSKESMIMKEAHDQFIKQHAHLETVYSPVQYINENQCVFAVENQFYVKKGNMISKLSKESIPMLSESFMHLCQLINDPCVIINEGENTITLIDGMDTIEINENHAVVNGYSETAETLKDLPAMHEKYQNFHDITYLTAAFLLENFDNIAELDFVKRIAMNESNAKTLDLFRVKDNIFIAAHDNINEDHTFYRNVKPLQLKSIINNHFGIKVSQLFEDLIPKEERIMKELKEIKEQYVAKIENLKNIKAELLESLTWAIGEGKERIERSLKDVTNELKESIAEYKKFQVKAAKIKYGEDGDYITESSKNTRDMLLEALEAIDELPDDELPEPPEVDPKPELPEAPEDFNMDADYVEGDSSDFGEDLDGSDGSEFDSSDGMNESSEADEDLFSSDGDNMSIPLEGSAEDFEVDPFDDGGSDIDSSIEASASEDKYSLGAEPDPSFAAETEIPDDDNLDDFEDDGTIDTEDDPFGEETEKLLPEPEGTEKPDVESQPGLEEKTEETEQVADDADLNFKNFKIVKVDFDINLHTGDHHGSGKVIVVVPWVDDQGNSTSKTESIDFIIKDIKGERGVILNTAGMSLEMYNAIVSAIKSSPDYEKVEEEEHTEDLPSHANDNGEEPKSPEASALVDQVKDEIDDMPSPFDDGTYEPEPFDSGSDETTVITIDDGIQPHGIDPASLPQA